MLQRATAKKKTAKSTTVDLTFGFPGRIPRSRQSKDQARFLNFFTEYVKDMNARAAARRVGFSEKWAKQYSYGFLKEHADYVKWLQAHAVQQAVKQIVIDQEIVLQEIARIGMVNEFDYLVVTPQDGDKPATVRRKRLDELTREQMTAIKVTCAKDGLLGYELRDKEGKLTELAKHVGLLNEKIILERRNLHMVKYDFSGIPIEVLEMMERRDEAELLKYGGARALEPT